MPKYFIILISLFFGIISPTTAQTSKQTTDSVSVIQNDYALSEKSTAEVIIIPSNENPNRIGLILRGLLGMIVLLTIAYLFSNNRKAVSLKLVGVGLGFQIVLAISVLYVDFVQAIIQFIGKIFVIVLDSSAAGADFLFTGFLDQSKYGYIFAFQVLPTIIFFSALMSLLFYLGIVQRVVFVMAWLLKKILGMSGPESLAVAGNVFLGQTESPLLIKAYLPKLTGSEIFVVMTSGMATIAGGVMAAYIGLLSGNETAARELFATHLITASVMAAPGAVVIAKILFPQTEDVDENISIPKEQIGQNALDSVGTGAYEGLKLAANVAVMLLVFYAFIALFNKFLGWTGKIPIQHIASDDPTTLNELIASSSGGNYSKLSFEYLLGQIFAPLMWLIGVPKEDLSLLGRLMGEKIIFTEFVSFANLRSLMEQNAIHAQKSILMATYMLCGFANIASVGIQIGGIGSLAPNKRVFLSKYGMKALLGGTLASLLSATIIGIIA